MPWYTKLPTELQTVLEKKTGAKPRVKVIYDPDGFAVQLSGRYDVVSVTSISNERELDIAYSDQTMIQEITMVLNDPDGFLNPLNPNGLFYQGYGELSSGVSSGASSFTVTSKKGFSPQVRETLIINDGTSQETVTVNDFSGPALSRTILSIDTLTNSYDAGTPVYTESYSKKDFLIRLQFVGCETWISCYRGRIIAPPVCQDGRTTLILANTNKLALDVDVAGADRDSDKKLMRVGANGTLENSVEWEGGWGLPPYEWEIESGALPSGITLNTSTGTLSGTPLEDGTFEFTLRVTNDDGESKNQLITLEVEPEPANTELVESQEYTGLDLVNPNSADVSFSENDGYLTFELDGSFKLDSSYEQGPRVYFTEPADPITTSNWVLECKVDLISYTDWTGIMAGLAVKFSTSKDYVLFGFDNLSTRIFAKRTTVGNLDYITTYAGGNTVYLKIRYSSGTFSFNYKANECDAWTHMGNSTQSGTIDYVGIFACTVNITNFQCKFDYMRFYEGALDIATSVVTNGVKGAAYSATIKASGGQGGYTFQVISGILPDGLTLSTAGILSGTPTQAGTFNFTVQVTDSNSDTASQSFEFQVLSFQSSDISVLPNVAAVAVENSSYSQAFNVLGAGELDRTAVTVYDGCKVGRWNIEFTSDTDYTISGPGISSTGNINSTLTLPGFIQIPSSAWGGLILEGYKLSFLTGISWVDENSVQAIYDLLTANQIGTGLIGSSSYFGNKLVGMLYERAGSGATAIKIRVNVPTLLKTGATLTITEGTTTEDIAISTGNDTLNSYPPYVQVGVSALTNSYSMAAQVELKQSAAVDTGNELEYTFDNAFSYCDDNSLNISLTLDTAMKVLQALEVISAHFDGFAFQDNWGVYHIHTFKASPAGETLPEINSNNALKIPDPQIEELDVVNEIIVYYGFDYANESFLYTLTYPATNAENKSFIRNGYKRTKELYLPGFYSSAPAQFIAQNKYRFWEGGVKLVRYNLTLLGALARLGDRQHVVSDQPDFDLDVELIGLSGFKLSDGFNVELLGYAKNGIFD